MFDIYLKGILLVLLLLCSYWDIKERRIPNRYLLDGLCIRVLFVLCEMRVEGTVAIRNLILQAVFCILFIGVGILLQRLTRNGIGMGDIKLMALMLFYLQVSDWFNSILWGTIFGIAIGVFVKAGKEKEARIPFAPALTSGFILVLFMGMR